LTDQGKIAEEFVQVVSAEQVKTKESSQQADLVRGEKQGDMSEQNEKVHIPDTFEDSEADSESLSEKLRSIDAYNDGTLGSNSKGGQDDQHIWHMEVEEATGYTSNVINEELMQQSKGRDKDANSVMQQLPSSQVLHDEDAGNVINSQESVITDDGGEKDGVMGDKMLVDKTSSEDDKGKEDQPECRRSERLKKDVLLTTMEKNDAMARKRNLEGNSKIPRNLSDVDNSILNSLAKNMGVVIQNENFATFDVLKDLESARNCLYAKQQKNNAKIIFLFKLLNLIL
jgi:hypothetical protein